MSDLGDLAFGLGQPGPLGSHPADGVIGAYLRGELDTTSATSVELHSQRCVTCRFEISARADHDRLAANWSFVEAETYVPRATLSERLLRSLRVRSETVRLLVATPSLRRSWFIAIAVALLFGMIAASDRQPDGGSLLVFLTFAPLIPVLGVALAYGRAVDPAYEMLVATPISGLRLVLTRAIAVLAVTLLSAGTLSLLAIADQGLAVAAWLLPALGSSLACLALMTRWAPRTSAAAVSIAWLSVVLIGSWPTGDPLGAFGLVGQIAMALVALAAAAVLIARRSAFDRWAGVS